MKIKSTPHNVAQIIQNSEFWQRAMFALRYADSMIDVTYGVSTGVMTADLQDRDNELHTHKQEITDADYRALVLHLLKHCGKHRSAINHDVNFAKDSQMKGRPKTKQVENVRAGFAPLDAKVTEPVRARAAILRSGNETSMSAISRFNRAFELKHDKFAASLNSAKKQKEQE